MARIKQSLLDELEARGELDSDDSEPYSPPSPAAEFYENDDAEVSAD